MYHMTLEEETLNIQNTVFVVQESMMSQSVQTGQAVILLHSETMRVHEHTAQLQATFNISIQLYTYCTHIYLLFTSAKVGSISFLSVKYPRMSSA